MAGAVDPYVPIGVPKPIGRDIWIVDGPVVRMRYGLGSLPFPTRMTVVRLPDGRLWLHSPVKITSGLVPRRMAWFGMIGGPLLLIGSTGALFDWWEQTDVAFLVIPQPLLSLMNARGRRCHCTSVMSATSSS